MSSGMNGTITRGVFDSIEEMQAAGLRVGVRVDVYGGDTYDIYAENQGTSIPLDNGLWAEVVVSNGITPSELTTAQNDIVGGSIFKGSNGEYVQNGDNVPAGTTHLRVLVGGEPAIVAMSPVSSGAVSLLTETSATIGTTAITFNFSFNINFKTLEDAINYPKLRNGMSISVDERSSGNDGAGVWDVVLASSVTPNGFNIVECTGVASLYLVLRDTYDVDIRQLGDVTGVDDTDLFQHAVNTCVKVNIPHNVVVNITSDITVPASCLTIYGDGVVTMPSDVKITNAGTLPAPSAVVNITTEPNTNRVDLGGDYTGEYVWVDNGLPDMIVQAEHSPGNGVPVGSIEALNRSRTNYSFNTQRRALYEIVGYDSATGESILDANIDFNIATGTATVYSDVSHLVIEGLTIKADYPTSTPAPSARGNIQFNYTHKGGMRNVKFFGAGVYLEIGCSHCVVADNKFNTTGPVRLAIDVIHNTVSGNSISHQGNGDASLIVYKNARNNTVVGNTITAPVLDHISWGIVAHTNSDHNTIVGNTVTASLGIGDYMFNKENVFSANTVTCYRMLVEGVVNTRFEGNNITIVGTSSNILKSEDVLFLNNTFTLDSAAAADSVIFQMYESIGKPFNFQGFTDMKTEKVVFKDNKFMNKNKPTTVDYRTFVDYSSGNGSLYFPRDYNVYLSNSKVAILNVEGKLDNLEVVGNEFENFNADLVMHVTSNVTTTELRILNNTHSGCDAAYIAKTDDPSEQTSLYTLNVYGDKFNSVDIAILSAQWPAYAKGCRFIGVNSCMALASTGLMVYGALLDIDNQFLGQNITYYDYTGNDATYLGFLTETEYHKCAYFIPEGAEYYQPPNLNASQAFYFRNFVAVFGSNPSNKTIKRTITETSYS